MYKLLGLLSIVLTWCAIFLLLRSIGTRSHLTISKHTALTRKGFLYMALAQSFILPAYALFIAQWYSPHFDLPGSFTVLNIASSVLLLIAAWVPDNHRFSNKLVHGICAYSAYILFVPIVVVGFANTHGVVHALFMTIGIYFVLIFSGFALTHNRSKMLYIQISVIGALHCLIFATTLIGSPL